MKKTNQPTLGMVDVYPRPKFLFSFRHNTLTNWEALADLADNPLDEDVAASKIRFSYKKEPAQIVVADNGSGMSLEVLTDAMRLGAAGKNLPKASDKGLYGIGMKNSSMSLGKSLKVITKVESGKFYSALYDIDEIVRLGDFKIPIYDSDAQDISEFKEHNPDSNSGTVLIITKLDRLELKSEKPFVTKLKNHLGEVFRVFINDGVEFYVNDERVEAREPLKSYTTQETEINDQVYEFKRPDGSDFSIRIKFGFLPQILNTEKTPYNLALDHQGFYIMRNNRQLMRSNWLSVRVKDNHLNRVRAEILFSGDLDDVFYINYEKNNINLNQWFRDALREKVKGVIKAYEDRARNDIKLLKPNDEESLRNFEKIKENIDSRADRLAPIKTKKVKRVKVANEAKGYDSRKSIINGNGTKEDEIEDATAEVEILSRSTIKQSLVEFEFGRLGQHHICFFEDTGNGSVTIRWNVEHAFYDYFNGLGAETQTAFAKLLLAMGRTIINLSNDTEAYNKMVNDLQIMMGDELRKLMD
jgi:Histidine kinase-, DNA gyrase B-, and HSP90-like ATPase